MSIICINTESLHLSKCYIIVILILAFLIFLKVWNFHFFIWIVFVIFHILITINVKCFPIVILLLIVYLRISLHNKAWRHFEWKSLVADQRLLWIIAYAIWSIWRICIQIVIRLILHYKGNSIILRYLVL
jgi:hypothetical protein